MLAVCMGVGKNFSRGGHKWIFPRFFYGGPTVVKFGLALEIKKTAFFAEIFKFQPLFRHPSYACV